MAQVLINDTTLSALGDAIRGQKSEEKYKYLKYDFSGILTKAESSSQKNSREYIYFLPELANENSNFIQTVILDATLSSGTISIEYGYGSFYGEDFYRRGCHDVSRTQDTLPDNLTKEVKQQFKGCGDENVPYIVVWLYNYYSDVPFTLTIETNILSSDLNPDTNYTPKEMVDEVNNFILLPQKFIKPTGDCSKLYSGIGISTIIKDCGDKISTNDITNAEYMFQDNTSDDIPFDINLQSDIGAKCSGIFMGCTKLKKLPYIIGKPNSFDYSLYNLYNLREIPEDWAEKIDWSYIHSNINASLMYIFYNCYSLRKVPQNLIDNLYSMTTSSSYSPYYGNFNGCCVLDEVLKMPVLSSNITSSHFYNFLRNVQRLKRFTFATNEDGTPKTANWKSQTIDLSVYAGYTSGSSYITGYNSGLTTATQIKDDASYQLLKDNPDSWTMDVKYSRYNHDSAVETINSLPDTSAYLATSGGTNTIKFKGSTGSATDGGAISNLTPEEIAVATSKGWTVSIV